MLATVAGLPWTFCPIKAMGDPGAGLLRFNSDVFEDVSVISISDALADKRNPDVSRYVATWDKSTTLDHRGTLIITKRGPGPEAFAIFKIGGPSTDREGWTELSVQHVDSFGSFNSRDPITVQFIPTGNASQVVASSIPDPRIAAVEEALLAVAHELASTKQQVTVLQGALSALRDEAQVEG